MMMIVMLCDLSLPSRWCAMTMASNGRIRSACFLCYYVYLEFIVSLVCCGWPCLFLHHYTQLVYLATI